MKTPNISKPIPTGLHMLPRTGCWFNGSVSMANIINSTLEQKIPTVTIWIVFHQQQQWNVITMIVLVLYGLNTLNHANTLAIVDNGSFCKFGRNALHK